MQSTPTPGVGPAELVEFWPVVVRLGWFLVGALLTVLLGWYVAEPAISRVIRRRNRNNPTIQEALSRYVRVLVVVVAVFVGAGTAGYGQFLGSSALVIAALTLAIGVAAQTVIGSLVSGLVLVVDPEFNIGNYIRWTDGEGEVRSITLRVTRVHTPDGTLVTIPNTTLTGEAIARPYGRGYSRLVEHVGVDYAADVDEALEQLRAAAVGLEGVVAEPAPTTYVEGFGDDAIVLRVHYWVEEPRHRDLFAVRSAYARAAKVRLDRAGIEISPASKRELQGRIEIEDARS